jgi:integrase
VFLQQTDPAIATGSSGFVSVPCTGNREHTAVSSPRLPPERGSTSVHAHGLRHAHVAEMVAEGVPVNVVQQQLGHGSLTTTDRYLRHIAPKERVEGMLGGRGRFSELQPDH